MTRWLARLDRAARSTLGEATPERIDTLLAGPLAGLPMAALVARSLGSSAMHTGFEARSLDESLWAALSWPERMPHPPEHPTGPMTGMNERAAIEVWTETELACVHAAWSLGGPWRGAALASAFWLLEHIQPDNATNHPWALHVFAAAADETGNPELDLYAQSLLHNCQVATGRPDEFSALILLHALRSLQAG